MDEIERNQHDQFLRLFVEHEEGLRLFVRSLLFSQEESREVMQDIAMVLWRKFDPSFDSLSFRRWAFGVARMEVLSFRRDRARDRHCFGSGIDELLAETVMEQSDSMERERRALEVCLKKLPDPQRALVEQAYAPRVRIDDYAKSIGVTAMALYKKLHRIRLSLMECTRNTLAEEDMA